MKILKQIELLWIDQRTGYISHSKFWNNIACAVATILVIRMDTSINIEFFQWYLGLVGFQAIASQFIKYKLGGNLPKEDSESEVEKTKN